MNNSNTAIDGTEQPILTDELKIHIQSNITTEDYKGFPIDFDLRDGKWGAWVEWEKLRPYQLTTPIENLEIIRTRIDARAKINEIAVGDVIEYKDGKRDRVTYIWEQDGQIQAGGGFNGGFYMNKDGYSSYSGSLSSGLHIDKLQATKDNAPAYFWFFSKDWTGGNRGIDFQCPVKIWKEI